VGIDLERKLVLADLSQPKHTHILVVGTTGSGKSEWLRMAMAGLMLSNTPETLRLVLIDPKRNAFNEAARSPFLWEGRIVYPDEHPVLETFEALVEEMEERYRLFQPQGVDDLAGLAKKGVRRPRIVCICDEYADLLQGAGKQARPAIERQFTRLGAKARAAGIHLVIATQEARRETIRGSLDANLPARVGLRVNKDIESRLLLQENGAEKLLGHGDLLFKDIGAPVRLQAPLVSRDEREAIFGG
jgi:DNA segregation ATPase FtsK/SpoIIIE, S-DNA-T family